MQTNFCFNESIPKILSALRYTISKGHYPPLKICLSAIFIYSLKTLFRLHCPGARSDWELDETKLVARTKLKGVTPSDFPISPQGPDRTRLKSSPIHSLLPHDHVSWYTICSGVSTQQPMVAYGQSVGCTVRCKARSLEAGQWMGDTEIIFFISFERGLRWWCIILDHFIVCCVVGMYRGMNCV